MGISIWYVYLLCCADKTYYTGICTDLQRRLHEHNHLQKGAKYTRSRRPVTLVWSEKHLDRASASRREYQLRKLPRATKEKLILETGAGEK